MELIDTNFKSYMYTAICLMQLYEAISLVKREKSTGISDNVLFSLKDEYEYDEWYRLDNVCKPYKPSSYLAGTSQSGGCLQSGNHLTNEPAQ